ncbi:hypothetical protein I5E72_10125 [Proteus terrae]|uniref:hypothetical protein n=1 Tax=Proteus terrae TaxID=1574161 RepID=UPI0018C6667E|nr:hypothetical protein [Proteus terrae]MBG5950099.1 hypothetical protein [Proteus terrae]
MDNYFDEVTFINRLFKETIEGKVSWSLPIEIPRILHSRSEFTITSCYKSSQLTNGANFYLFFYRVPEYYGEHDTFYNVERVRLTLIQHDQITWQSQTDSSPIYKLYDYVSSRYSGIDNIFG